ncbi:MAG: 30S ribosomal protein S4 [Candidatus Taylorbacteria bacterium]|nr:30S ribosomal protein S4 [Candidatus Taylorbacteria bacterium]
MIIGPRYKIARRLGVGVFEKTQTQKFAMRSEQKKAAGKSSKPRAKSDYGLGLLEKQKARYSYGITSKQFGNYVAKATDQKGNSGELLVSLLESRFDNVALRSGFATTRQAARQMTSHGHLTINGKIVTIPSYHVKVGDVIAIREGSKKKALFSTLDERLKAIKLPAWLKLNFDKKEVTVEGIPRVLPTELLFNVGTVLEFYSR